MEILDREEELNPYLYAVMRDMIKRLVDSLNINIDFEKLRENLSKEICKICENRISRREIKYVAIDSSISSPPIDTLSGSFVIYTYGFISNVGKKVLKGGIKIVSDKDKFMREVILKERKLVIEVLKRDLDLDLIILDGPINNFPGNPFYISTKYRKVFKEMFNLLDEKGVSLVSIPKNVRTMFLALKLNIQLDSYLKENFFILNDRSLCDLLLNKGEYVILGKYKDLLFDYLEFSKEIKENVSISKEAILEVFKEIPQYKNIDVFIYKTNIGIKAEAYIPENSIDLEDIIGFLYKNSGFGNLDFPIMLDKVDEFVRVSSEDTYNIYLNLLKFVDERCLKFLKPSNPQKMYLIKKTKFRK